tara:strand:+ start:2850 stop:3215 length:366 start_codon:yes stop_codon:yes gene_type:complete
MAKKKEDEIPQDIDAELKSPKFGKPNPQTRTGYFLNVDEKDKKVDIQLYETLSGTTILEGLNISKDVNLNDIEKGVMCEFQLDELKAPLSKKTVDYLKEQGITLDTIVQFELKEFKIIEEN